jgi:hypothetical protein
VPDAGRTRVASAAQGHPLLGAWLEHAELLACADRIDVQRLEHARRHAESVDGIARPTFRAQDPALLADGLHYESRIARDDVLATREHNPHDLFNALVWLRHPALKRALNARQVEDIRACGSKVRTRGQCALTHFDEAGAIVWLADGALLRAWDVHDWPALFAQEAAWGTRIAVTVFGHALIEHVWNGHTLPVAKALVVQVPQVALTRRCVAPGALVTHWRRAEERIAGAIADGGVLADPQELRPLPLAGIPGWHAQQGHAHFHRDTPCFRPLRPGRRYPPPLDGSPLAD